MTAAKPPADWTLAAACAFEPTDIFYPDNRQSIAQGRIAKAICKECPVKTECLADAYANNERWGVRGGLSAYERDELRKKNRRKKAGA